MSLSEEKRALLELLLAGDGYEQVAELLGTTPGQVRQRAHEALAELERSGEAGAETGTVRDRLAELDGPGGTTPPPPADGASARVAGRRRRSLPLAAVGLGAALAAALVVFLLVRGGGSESEAPAPAPPADQEDVVEVKLEPVGGSGASGTARLVRVEDLPAVDLEIDGLAPTRDGETYVIWLLGSGRQGLPIAFRAVGANGKLSGRIPLPSAAAGLLPSVAVIDVSQARQAAVSSAVSRAAESGTLPFHLGTTVLRGRLP